MPILGHITSGLVNGLIEILFSISLASLIFSGPLEPYLPRGISIALVTAAVHILFTTIFRTKGLEFDYVILPQCNENALPYLKGERISIYDNEGHCIQAAARCSDPTCPRITTLNLS